MTALLDYIDHLYVISWVVHMALFSHIKRKMLMISMNMVKWCIYIGNFWVAFYRYRYGYIGTNTDTDIYIGIGASLKIMRLACCYMIKPPGF